MENSNLLLKHSELGVTQTRNRRPDMDRRKWCELDFT
jgi:hypothetical protein